MVNFPGQSSNSEVSAKNDQITHNHPLEKESSCFVNHGFSSTSSLAPAFVNTPNDTKGDMSRDEPKFQRFRERFSKNCNSNLAKRRLPFLVWVPTLTLRTVLQDFLAGLTIALTAIPQGIAYGSVAGVPVEYGLYTAFAGPIVYALLGSVAQVTVGPTAVMALMTSEFVQIGGAPYAVMLSFLTGCIEILAGLFNLGFLVELISASVIFGFCSAAATTVIFSQIKIMLGLKFPGSSCPKVIAGVFSHWQNINVWDALLGLSFIILLLLMKNLPLLKKTNHEFFRIKWVDKTIWCLATCRNALALVIACTLTYVLRMHGLQPFSLTGDIKTGVPFFQVPPFSFEVIAFSPHENGIGNSSLIFEGESTTETIGLLKIVQDLGTGLITVPIIAILEQVAIAKAQVKGEKLDSTQEILALGTGSVVCSFLGCFPLTASFALSSVMSASGANTQLASLINGCMVLLALVFLMPAFYFIPKPVLGAVIVTAVYTKLEYHEILPMWRTRKIELIPFIMTYICCIFIGMEYGILIGAQIHLLLTVFEASRTKCDIRISKDGGNKAVVLSIDRSLYFPSVDRMRKTLHKLQGIGESGIKLLIDFNRVSTIDYTSLKVLQASFSSYTEAGIKFSIVNANNKTQNDLLAFLNDIAFESSSVNSMTSSGFITLEIETGTSKGSGAELADAEMTHQHEYPYNYEHVHEE